MITRWFAEELTWAPHQNVNFFLVGQPPRCVAHPAAANVLKLSLPDLIRAIPQPVVAADDDDDDGDG